tara:strand:+ start:1585 stop:2400 length:816 start_codon:yes stop_codon:yes gene_type:complete
MKSFKEIRSINYEHRRDEEDEFYVDIDDWFKSPYTSLKARYYIEISSVIVFLLQSTRITPNQVSIFYGFLGLLAGFFLCFKNDVMIYLGLVIFFLKGVVDWSDGLLARVTEKTSSIGHVIDTWGSHIGYYSLIFGIGFICFNNNNEPIYLILTLSIFLISIIDFKLFSYHQLFYEILSKNFIIKNQQESADNLENQNNNEFLKRIKHLLSNFLDDRARTLDLICFIIFLGIIFNISLFAKIILYLFLIKKILVFLGNFFEIIILQKLKNKI